MIEKSCAFQADSFVRVDSSELTSSEPARLENEVRTPQLLVDDQQSTALPKRSVEVAALPAPLPTEREATTTGDPDDLAIVARGRGGIKRRRYELRISYYLSFCFRFGFLLGFLQRLLGGIGGARDRGTRGEAGVAFEPDQSGTVSRRS
jgi:hypothetical protein